MNIKKKAVALLLTGVVFGAVVSPVAVAGVLRLAGYRTISATGYEEYQELREEYGFLNALKELVQEEYYLPIEDDTSLINGMYKGLVSGLGDPYSEYLTPEEFEQAYADITGNYCGVGVTMWVNEEDYIEVVSVIDDSPAQQAGIRTGDVILGVDGVAYGGSQMSKAAELIRGDAGTEVTLTILRDGKMQNYTMERKQVTEVTVQGQMMENSVAYLRITRFEMNTGEQFDKALAKLEEQGAQGLIIDLRNNGGGMVDSAVQVVDALLDEATVIYAEDRNGRRTYYKTEAGKTQLPYVLLVDGGTASAAEILAEGVQDNEGGLIIGQQTYGKGIIQSTQQLINGAALKMTTMQYYSPKGTAIHGIGVTPDVTVELSADDVDENGDIIDRQLEKAMEFFRKVQ